MYGTPAGESPQSARLHSHRGRFRGLGGSAFCLIASALFGLSTLQIVRGEEAPAPNPAPSRAEEQPKSINTDTEPLDAGTQIAAVLIEGNTTIPDEAIRRNLRVRLDRPVTEKIVRDDVRALYATKWFFSVEPRYRQGTKGTELVFRVVERPIVQSIEYRGAKQISTKHLAALTGLKPGSPYDVQVNQESTRRIESHYHEKGHAYATVKLIKGNSKDDRDVVFDIQEGPKVRVTSISFVGNEYVSGPVLATKIRTKKAILWYFGGQYDPASPKDDVTALKQYYHGLGFFEVKVEHSQTESADRASVHFHYKITEGIRFKIRNIEVLGNKIYTKDQLQKSMKITPGEYFNARKLSKDVDAIKDMYGTLGHMFARVEAVPRYLEKPGEADLVYQIAEDKPWRIRKININIRGDNPHTQRATALNRMLVAPGDLADPAKIRKSEPRLGGAQIFERVGPEGPQISVRRVDVDEKSRSLRQVRGQSADIRGQSPSIPSQRPFVRGQSPTDNGDASRSPTPTPKSQQYPTTRVSTGGLFPPNRHDFSAPDPRLGGWHVNPASSTGPRRSIAHRPETPSRLPRASSAQADSEPQDLAIEDASPAPSVADGNPPTWPRDLALLDRPDSNETMANTSAADPVDIPQLKFRPFEPADKLTADPLIAPLTISQDNDPFASDTRGAGGTRGFSNRLATGTLEDMSYPLSTNLAGSPSVDPSVAREIAALKVPAHGWTWFPTSDPSFVINRTTRDFYLMPTSVASESTSRPGSEIADGKPIIRGQNYQRGLVQPGNPIFGNNPGGDPLMPAPQEPPGFLDLDVDVTEARTGRLMFGVGVNSDAGLVGSVVLTEQNFDLFRPPTSFQDIYNGTAWRGAGQRFRLEAVPGTVVSRYLVSWTDPYVFNTDYSLSLSGFFFNRFYTDWDEQRAGGRIAVGRQLTQQISVSGALRLEDVKLDNAHIPTPSILQKSVGSNFLSTFALTGTHDTRDSPFLPGEGHLIELTYEQAFGEFLYPRVTADARQYFTVFADANGERRHTVTVGGQLSWTDSGTPIFERFYAGGFQTFRGFEFRGVTPREGGVRVGGQFMAIGSVEYMFPMMANEMLHGVVFSDFGTVENSVRFDDFRLSAGAGLRVTIPAMGPVPLAFDFAYPLIRQDFDDKQIFSFYVGVTR